jgi:hypothetical protein
MRTIGIILIVISFLVGILSDNLPQEYTIEPFVGMAFVYFLLGMFFLIKREESFGVPKMRNPPAPPKKCICNDIGKHSPGGTCEAEHSRPEFPTDRS